MNEQINEEECRHAWVYYHTEHDTVYLQCSLCRMVRIAMPNEPCHLVSRELNIRHDDCDGDV